MATLKDVQTKIAYAIGWITHRASDHQVKPLLRALEKENDPRFNSYLNSVYFDAKSFREAYNGGKTPSKSKNQILSSATFEIDIGLHERLFLIVVFLEVVAVAIVIVAKRGE